MGTGIAQVPSQPGKERPSYLALQVAAQANQKVALVDLSQDILNKAEKRIAESLR